MGPDQATKQMSLYLTASKMLNKQTALGAKAHICKVDTAMLFLSAFEGNKAHVKAFPCLDLLTLSESGEMLDTG